MSSEGGDALRIPIEIKTDDLQEIQDLINEISKAESDIDVLKPRKGKGTGDVTSRSAFAREDEIDERGGVFGMRTDDALPTAIRDKKSRSPLQRENEFSKMRDQVEQQNQGNIIGSLVNAGFVGNLAGFKGVEKFQKAQSVLPLANIATGGLRGGVIGAAGFGGGLKSLAGKAGIFGMLAMVAMEVVQSTIEFLYRPGGALDKRFKRDMDKESVRMIDLNDKSDINQGRRIVRVTTATSLRGTDSQVRSSLDVYKSGQRIYDMDGQNMVKNTGVGEI
jgi:hypothetical protein